MTGAAIMMVLLMAESAADLYRRGVDLFAKGDAGQAAAVLAEAARMDPRNPQIHKALGVVYASRGDYEHAQQPFETACRIAPDLEDACYYLGRNLYALNRFSPSLDALRKALRHSRYPARVRLGIAQALEALSEAKEAECEFRIAIAEWNKLPNEDRGNPEFDPNAHFALFLMRQGRQKEALEPARSAVEWAPESPRARFELGRLLYLEGKLSDAEAELRKAVALGHGDAARLLLGKTLVRMGRAEEAGAFLSASPQ